MEIRLPKYKELTIDQKMFLWLHEIPHCFEIEDMEKRTTKIVEYAISAHANTNHFYGDKPYSFHLENVVNTAIHYINLIPLEAQEDVLAACWCHDLIEDARQSYNDVKINTNKRVADIVYAVSTEKGHDREERQCAKYYEGIRNTPFATFVKLCDRIANSQHGLDTRSRMFEKYKSEMPKFKQELYTEQYDSMFKYLDELYKYKLNQNDYVW